MLEIKKITKVYNTGGFKQKALDGVSVNFRKCEFASILGPSGSGKTTMLNIIGGLDKYTSGDLIINEMSTKKFKDSDWDSYRNHRIGFVFQNYNLIGHQSILSNVRLALTLSGISKSESIARAKKVLKEVGLEDHMYKKPNQLSGGQMQRVAIARALVNDPEILLADEPTGALDSETSIQIMKILKSISKDRLVIMVTHNPELAKEYSTRIINLKDGKITSDSNPYDGKENTKESENIKTNKNKKTSMSFLTALSLSFNNLMTKKARTILVAFAGSIGIIGIALILAVSTGFQNYVDSIQEDTLTSYPLNIMQESTDITSMLLAMQSSGGENNGTAEVKEQQYLTNMLTSISTNDLKSFKEYVNTNYDIIKDDISTIKYAYSVDPLIYTIDASGELAKLNPSNLFSSIYSSNVMSSYSSFGSIFSQMIDNKDTLNSQYDVLAGHWPEKYNEVVIILSEPNSISDLLVYSLGLRKVSELNEMVQKLMTGEKVNINNEAKSFTYEDLLAVKLKMINPADMYKYNAKYDVYEDMSTDDKYMQSLYNKAEEIRIVGIVSVKPGVSGGALDPGVGYRSDLINHIIDYAKNTDVVKKQIKNSEVDVFSGNKFNSKTNRYDFKFSDLVSVDSKKLQSAFGGNINQQDLENQTKKYIGEINDAIKMDSTPAFNKLNSVMDSLTNGLFASLADTISINEVNTTVENYLNNNSSMTYFKELETNYVLPKESYKSAAEGLLKSLLQIYIMSYYATDQSLTTDPTNPTAKVVDAIKDSVVSTYNANIAVKQTKEKLSQVMTEAKVKKEVLTKVGELTTNLTNSLASSFKVDPEKITGAFTLRFSKDELSRVVSAMMNPKESTQKTNLLSLGYQDLDEPTYISFYFNSFDGKEHFLSFIDEYNTKVKNNNEEDKVINYTDTTGILMGSVKTIVNAVSYVLIAFVSISLVVSSIMIGIITYISVYERTKEIGILRSIGASKKNISSIFNAETFIIGLLSGLFGIGLSEALIPVINTILHHFTGNIPLKVVLPFRNAVVLIVLSIILTLIGGFIPARKASKRDPVEALRSE